MQRKSAVKAGVKNWKTTAIGVMSGVIVILTALRAVIDGDPETVPDGNAAIESAIGVFMILLGFFSRDADKTSEESGAR